MTAGPRYQVQDCVTVCLDCGVVVIITEAHDRYHSIQSSWAWMRWRRQYERACVREARLREVRRRGTYVQPGGMFVDPAQTPTTLMEPSMEAAQSPRRQEKS